jgi:ribonuclease J
VRVVFLGGLGEIGRNCACIEVEGRILVVDFGLMFPDHAMPGVDFVLPDFSYLRDNADRVEAVLLTHGHEDHVGGLSHLLADLSVPLYGSELTLRLAQGRLEEAGVLHRTEFRPVPDGQRLSIGPVDVQFVPVTHSVPHANAIAFFTPQGTILHSGDFKLDDSPVDGRRTDLGLIESIARQGVRLLLSDSTNSEEPGHTASESTVGPYVHRLFGEHPGKRVIAACFASHLHRVQQIATAAVAHRRRVAFLGRSMGQNTSLARQMGLFPVPSDAVVPIEEIDRYLPSEICIICTGSQGEPLSALSLMATGENKWVKVGADDLVVISATPIPGNEHNVHRAINGFYRRGAEVVHGENAPVHVSGHANAGDLQHLLRLVQPEWFVPVHGEYRHLVRHARLAIDIGMPEDRVAVCQDGDAVVLGDHGAAVDRQFTPGGFLFVDGIVGDVGRGVLRDRRVLSEEGMVVVVVTVDARTGAVLKGPEIVTRGWVYGPEAEELLGEARGEVLAALADPPFMDGPVDVAALQRHVREALQRYITRRTRRRPVVLPVVMEV